MIDARIPDKKPFEKSKGQILEIKKSFKKLNREILEIKKSFKKSNGQDKNQNITIFVILLEHRTKGWSFFKIEISRCLGIPTS